MDAQQDPPGEVLALILGPWKLVIRASEGGNASPGSSELTLGRGDVPESATALPPGDLCAWFLPRKSILL